MNQIEKLNLLYGKTANTRAALKKANQLFGFEFTDEVTGQHLNSNDLCKHFKQLDKTKNKTVMPKATTTTATEKKPVNTTKIERVEVSISQIPFFNFENEGELFTGAILRKHTLNFSGEEKQTFVCADELGDEVIMPTNVQLQMLLTTVVNTHELPCRIEIAFTGYKPTPKGRAKQFKVFTF